VSAYSIIGGQSSSVFYQMLRYLAQQEMYGQVKHKVLPAAMSSAVILLFATFFSFSSFALFDVVCILLAIEIALSRNCESFRLM